MIALAIHPTMTLSALTIAPKLHPHIPKTSFPPSSSYSSSCSCSCSSSTENNARVSLEPNAVSKRNVLNVGIGLLAASVMALSPLEANATRIEYYATVGEPLCEMNFARSGLGFCDLSVGSGVQPPRGELINIHYTARFSDGTVFDSTYKRGRPLTMRIGVGKVIKGLDQGIFGGEGVPPMQVGNGNFTFLQI
ncbi:photosynthetic NDH subunit of lumenal location 4, chloroplastic isoform X2 [Argentina anserina]|uniref:photosynthetic NDH subunit of lumenal location 4, chloroplastic isoform X2 n=1 Tax=Argentina anserina TaxID=57926 RepID=UPI0021767600|nr:photosynthetic NDH subunit of lumenal location 4, chloroplastic isoform X2 [Potentilla anserina]